MITLETLGPNHSIFIGFSSKILSGTKMLMQAGGPAVKRNQNRTTMALETENKTDIRRSLNPPS